MPKNEPENRLTVYVCGNCKGRISYLISGGRPVKCPECSYEHGTRDSHDIPSIVRLNLNELNNT